MPRSTPPITQNGYGYVTQAVMRDSKLSKVAKAIYGVLAVFADPNSLEAHPSTKFLCSIIGVTPQTFRNNRRQLRERGIIKLEYRHATPIYTVASNDLIERGKGYGYLPKSVMLESSLSRNARVLYAYLACFAGILGKSCPGIELIKSELGMSKDTLYGCRKELEDNGLVTITKYRAKDSQKYSNNTYILNENRRILGNTKRLATSFYSQSGLRPADYYRLLYDNTELTINQNLRLNQFIVHHDINWVNLAIMKARRHGKPFSYIIGIMDKWESDQLETVEEIKANDMEFYSALSKETFDLTF